MERPLRSRMSYEISLVAGEALMLMSTFAGSAVPRVNDL